MSNLPFIKESIESRYRRLSSGNRNPSYEYPSAEDIREVFKYYAVDQKQFCSLSDTELVKFYEGWLKEYKVITEPSVPSGETYPETDV